MKQALGSKSRRQEMLLEIRRCRRLWRRGRSETELSTLCRDFPLWRPHVAVLAVVWRCWLAGGGVETFPIGCGDGSDVPSYGVSFEGFYVFEIKKNNYHSFYRYRTGSRVFFQIGKQSVAPSDTLFVLSQIKRRWRSASTSKTFGNYALRDACTGCREWAPHGHSGLHCGTGTTNFGFRRPNRSARRVWRRQRVSSEKTSRSDRRRIDCQWFEFSMRSGKKLDISTRYRSTETRY